MADKIKLLPDAIANQIAAGEVIQRPASVVKELLENAIDAGAQHIKLMVKNAGKSLIQVIDNGSGMSEMDARMCFEKHATSKIREVDDLFNIRTMGFRGEALASIASIAQVEMRTRQWDETLGTLIEIEGMKVVKQESCQTSEGTSIAVRNLFYNVPARRNFLKSENVELKNIIEEFYRVALANPKISFQFFNDDHEHFHLKSVNLKQRICDIFDTKYAEQIVPLEENTYMLRISGFVGKPQAAKKTRGEQYIFVNNRFIKSAYLHHAITNAYDQLLAKDYFPFYVLFLEIEPSRIDINVHPQKYEVKFEDEKLVYTFVNLGVKHSLGAYAVSPTLDFEQEDHLNRNNTFTQSPSWISTPTESASTSTYNPFNRDSFSPTRKNDQNDSNLKHWQKAYETRESQDVDIDTATFTMQSEPSAEKSASIPIQIHRQYILSPIKSGFILIDQQAAHERILYEKYIVQLATNKSSSQRQLFPQTIHLEAQNAQIMREILQDVNMLGFDIQEFGQNSFVIHAFPADIESVDEKKMMEEFVEQYKNFLQVTKLSKRENVAKALAHSSSIKRGKVLSISEMQTLIDELFACENPIVSPNGKNTVARFSLDDLAKLFDKK